MTAEERQRLREARDRKIRERLAGVKVNLPADRAPRHCRHCDTLFLPGIYNQTYCDEECRKRARRAADRHRQSKRNRAKRTQAA